MYKQKIKKYKRRWLIIKLRLKLKEVIFRKYIRIHKKLSLFVIYYFFTWKLIETNSWILYKIKPLSQVQICLSV